MWCPNCKNEYVEGITHCADCGFALVDHFDAAQTEDVPEAPAPHAHAYVSKKTKQEDIKSTAYTFTFISILGIFLLILFATDVLPLHTAFYMKVMICIVMGAMFAIFLFIGIRSFGELKSIGAAALAEETLFSEVTDWFLHTYTADAIDDGFAGGQTEEQLYFSRYETMSRLLLEKYPDLEEAFLDHIIESLYGELFSL